MMNLPSRVADIRLFSEEGRLILSEKKPLEGFSRSVEDSIKEATSEATNTVQKGHDYLIWMLTKVFASRFTVTPIFANILIAATQIASSLM